MVDREILAAKLSDHLVNENYSLHKNAMGFAIRAYRDLVPEAHRQHRPNRSTFGVNVSFNMGWTDAARIHPEKRGRVQDPAFKGIPGEGIDIFTFPSFVRTPGTQSFLKVSSRT
jgi:hypothetical protein